MAFFTTILDSYAENEKLYHWFLRNLPFFLHKMAFLTPITAVYAENEKL
jgi:hypothetical protein